MKDTILTFLADVIVNDLGKKKEGLQVPSVTRDAKFADDLNLDSVDFVELIESVEEEYDLEIDVPQLTQKGMTTMGELVDYIEELTV